MDLEKETAKIIEMFKNRKKGGGAGIIIVILIVIALAVLQGAFYTIQPEEVGVVLRFGQHIRTTQPGLHLKIPFGIEKAVPVNVEANLKEEFGFRTTSPGVRTTYAPGSFANEALMLTGDLNILDISWIVQYKIKDPYHYLFNLRNVSKTIRDVSESVMRRLAGDYSFDEIISVKRDEINYEAQLEIQEILDEYEAGIRIVTVMLQDAVPPDPVKPSFNEVNEAKQDREKMINQAWEAYNKKIPEARGQALRRIEQAKGYNLQKVNTAKGDAERFNLLRREYSRAKEVTRKRIYLENMESVLARAGRKYIIDPANKNVLPLLRLENEK